MSGTQRNQSHPLAGAEDTLRDFWHSRPRRPRRGRKIAGVAAGIANRYAIDPVIVRVAFVIATVFGGAGVVLYLLGWLFFAEQQDEAAPFAAMVSRGRSSTSTVFTVVLCLALIPASAYALGPEGLAGGLLAAAAIYLLHRNREELGRHTTQPPVDAPPQQPTFTMPMDHAATAPFATPSVQQNKPPAWDPLGAAPFAWDLPEPTPAKVENDPPATRNRSRIGGITVGAALAIGGACALAAPSVAWLTPQHIVGLLLGVIGLGLIGGAFVRGGRGLIGLAAPLSLLGLVLTTAGGGTAGPGGGWGDIQAKPTTIESVRSTYALSAGSVNLDLTGLPATGMVSTMVDVGLGNAEVTVPATADVSFTCSTGLGTVECLNLEHNAPDAVVTGVDNGTDGVGGLKITLEVRANSGTVEVRRG